MQDYVHWVQQQQQYEIMGVPEWMVQDRALDHLDRLTDVIMTRLRTSEGLDLDDVEQEYGQDKVNRILRGVQLGIDLQLARRIGEEKGRKHGVLRLNDPAGFLFSNSIISSIFVELGVES
jgi:oxygen-independent coproporphyrinogen-3 oxidase